MKAIIRFIVSILIGELVRMKSSSGFIVSISIVVLLSASLVAPSLAQRPGRPGRQAQEQNQRGRAAGPTDQQIRAEADRTVQQMMSQHAIPAVVLAVVKDGRIVVEKGYGAKSTDSNQPPDENTVFYIGSLSKAITAVGAMMLVDKGKLNLDDPASRYMPDLPRNWSRITVRQFMTHTSGIPDLPKRQKKQEDTIQQAFKLAAGLPMSFDPGTKEQYNNFNFAVIGRLIEEISGQSYSDYMRENLFGPLGMNHTGGGILARFPNHATGYNGVRGNIKPGVFDVQEFGWPSGGLATTLPDLLKLDEALRSGRLMKQSTFQQMITKTDVGSGTPGWFTHDAGGVKLVTKNGAGSMGFSSMYIFAPGRGDSVIMIRNFAGDAPIQPPANQIMAAVLGIVPGNDDAGGAEADDGGQ
jgi:CubicO group peptidase (beta-lactamase class C family)